MYLQILSRDTIIVPDKWTPLFVGVESYINTVTPENIYKEGVRNLGVDIKELAITIWVSNNKSYEGSIFFDDINIYQ